MKVTEEWLAKRCEDDGGCQIWKLQVSRNGAPVYKFLKPDGKRPCVQVRRVAWELRNGPIPEGKRLTCTCTNPRCLTCLALVTSGEVIRQTWQRPDIRARRMAGVTKASRSRGKLDMEKARYIRASSATLKEVAGELGISLTLASLVRRGLAWKEAVSPFAGLGAR